MLTLLILRHAKSSWSDLNQSDHDRPLAPRGQAAAPLMGSWIASHDLAPDLVLCSSALRTRETAKLVLPALGGAKPHVEIEDELYHAGPPEILAKLQAVSPGPERVMIVGHNPGLHALANALVREGPRDLRSELSYKFPTAALAVIAFPKAAAWRDVKPGTGTLLHFVTPKGGG